MSQLEAPHSKDLTIPYEIRSRDFDNGTFDTVLGELLRRMRRKKVSELDKCSQREMIFLIDLIGKACMYLCYCAITQTDQNVS